eukprot:TRINITY_DN1592_c0_g1_i1.p1 TRINITY_DN1592_c0_g1~~TRINITY_DN1592_c0_g1_i1.p1  ORF type:complete len:165 (-),score=45.54 TRINITY_DN1592_c0_g1_i1:63-557(-)
MNMFHTPFTQYGANSEPLFDIPTADEFFNGFYEDVFSELCKYGEIEELCAARNLGDHLFGNVYVKFFEEESAERAMEGIRGRYYSGRPLVAELSPVTDFRQAKCRQYDVGECQRGGFCNYLHMWEPSNQVKKKLQDFQRRYHKKMRSDRRKEREKSRKRSDDRR